MNRRPADYDHSDAAALKALARGDATAAQQRRAAELLLEQPSIAYGTRQ